MSEPFLRSMSPVSMQRVRLNLRQAGLSHAGASQVLAGMPVGFATDRLLLAQLLVTAIGRTPGKPAEFKPAEFKPAEFKRAEFKPAEFRPTRR